MAPYTRRLPSYWRRIQRQNFTKIEDLLDFLEIDPAEPRVFSGGSQFPLNLPRRIACKIHKGDLTDPLLRQFLPLSDEHKDLENFQLDPVGDQASRRSQRLLHKYEGRALLVCTSACAMHCRYCFRQHFDYPPSSPFSEELELLRDDASIQEVLLSGGDPLSLDNRVIEELLNSLALIPHIQRVRFHTRFPIGIPERIDEDLLELLKNSRLQIFFVVHCNHPRELDDDIVTALKQIQKLGIPVLNQAVLLKGVNDDVDTLQSLCESLSNHGILPYYLHQLDRVQGAAHFEVPEPLGLALISELRKRLPGYAVPSYVKEIAGEASKTPL